VIDTGDTAFILAAAIVLGPRKGYGKESFMPHNLPMTLIGTGLLLFGWFGFNGGSALAANGIAATAFVSTHLGGMAGMAMWTLVEWLHRGKPTTLGAASGAIAGLATITPAAGFVGPNAAVIIGLIAGASCYYGVSLKGRLGYDDSLDVVGIYAFALSWVMFKAVDMTMGLRLAMDSEESGLDLSEHSETAYS